MSKLFFSNVKLLTIKEFAPLVITSWILLIDFSTKFLSVIIEIRGVSSREMVRKLLFKGLVDLAGKSDLPGRPMLYKTTDKFLDYFNLSSIEELPKMEEDVELTDEEKDLFISKYKEKDKDDDNEKN